MSYQFLLTLLGALLILAGVVQQGWFLVATWLGANFLILGVAHRRGWHGVFGKRPTGTLPIWSQFLFLPLLIYTWAVWHLVRLFSREPAYNTVTEQMVVGRRLLASELNDEFENYVDLTAEFSEPSAIRQSPAYRSFPILDGAAPKPEALRAAVASLRPGKTYIHCAQGHGRTGLFAIAVLLSLGAAKTVEDSLRILRAVRPGIRLSRNQLKCIQKYARDLSV